MKIQLNKVNNEKGTGGGISVRLKKYHFGIGYVLQSKEKPVIFWKKVLFDSKLLTDVLVRQFNFFIFGNFALSVSWVSPSEAP